MDAGQHIAPGIQGAASAAALRQGLGPVAVGVLGDRSLFRSGRVPSDFALLVPVVIALAWSGVLFRPGARHLARELQRARE